MMKMKLKLPIEQAPPAGGASFTKTSWLGFTLLILLVQLWVLHRTLQIPPSPQDLTRARLPSLRPVVTEESENAAPIASLSATAAAANETTTLSGSHDPKSAEVAPGTATDIPTFASIAREQDEDVTPIVAPTAVVKSDAITHRAGAGSGNAVSSSALENKQVDATKNAETVSNSATKNEAVTTNDTTPAEQAGAHDTAKDDTTKSEDTRSDVAESKKTSLSNADAEQPATESPASPVRSEGEDEDSTPLDAALLDKYSEDCVELGTHHLESLFIKEGICVSRTRVQQILIDLVVVTSKVFTEHNITHFLESGTLLGAYRHKTVIPFDVDSDMGIDAAGYDKIKRTPIQFPPEYHLQVFDTNIHPVVSRYIELPVRVVHRETALYLDVFVYNDSVDDDGKEWTGPIPSNCYINCDKCPRIPDAERWELKIPRDWIYPLQDCRFAKHTFKCPAETERYLEYMFGENYMEPQPFY